MILDTHPNLRSYTSLFRGFDPSPVFEWLDTCAAVPAGQKIEFAGDKLFAKTLHQETKAAADFRWETHVEYVDLQYILSGGEIIQWTRRDLLTADSPYDAAIDFQYYAEAPAEAELRMTGGLFVFFFPTDGHRPQIVDGTHGTVTKVIVKIHRSLLAV